MVTALEAIATMVSASTADLAPLTAQVERVADAATISNTQVASVIGADANGVDRVRTEPLAP